jgi:hypothetical protein
MSDQTKPLTADQVHTLQHALGLDRDRREPWRNYYCATFADPALEALVELGMMKRGRPLNQGESRYYHVTPAGEAVARAGLPPKRTRSEARYLCYLHVSDVMPDLTFREFLRMEAEAR